MVGVSSAAVLALVAALCFGLQALTVQRGMEAGSAIGAAVISVAVSTPLFWALAVVRSGPSALLTSPYVLVFIVGGIIYPAGFRLCYFEGIDRVGPSVASALVASYPTISVILAVAFLGEPLTAFAVGGLVCVVGGGIILQIAGSRSQQHDSTDVVRRELAGATGRDIAYPVAATVLLGGASVLIDFGLGEFPHPVVATAITQSAGLIALLLAITMSKQTRSTVSQSVQNRSAVLAFGLAGVFVAFAWLAQFFALRLGRVVTVVPLISTYPLIVVSLSHLRERQVPSGFTVAGVLAIVAGVVLLQL